MASVLFGGLAPSELGSKADIQWVPMTLTIVPQEFLLRTVVKTAFSRPSPSPGSTERLEEIRDIYAALLGKLKRALGHHRLLITEIPDPSVSWWHQYTVLQPDGSPRDAFDDEYLGTLHFVLSTPLDDEASTAEPRCGGIDPILAMVRALQSETTNPIVVIDSSDTSTLAAMWEIHRRTEPIADIYMSPNFYPTTGMSVKKLRTFLSQRHRGLDGPSWENFLVCAPLLGMCGLPPLLMLQRTASETPIDTLANIVSCSTIPLLCEGTDGRLGLDMEVFGAIVSKLAEREPRALRALEDTCEALRDGTAEKREYCSIRSTGWDQFRLSYYLTLSNVEEVVKRRSTAYISGLIQLAMLYQGRVTKELSLSKILLNDAPLATDLLAVVKSTSVRFVGLDELGVVWEEKGNRRRTLLRIRPLITKSFPQ